jgi:hypothetical protein
MKVFTDSAKPFSASKNRTYGLNIVTEFRPCSSILALYPALAGRKAVLYSARSNSVDGCRAAYFFDIDELPELADQQLRFEEELCGNGNWHYYYELSKGTRG